MTFNPTLDMLLTVIVNLSFDLIIKIVKQLAVSMLIRFKLLTIDRKQQSWSQYNLIIYLRLHEN